MIKFILYLVLIIVAGCNQRLRAENASGGSSRRIGIAVDYALPGAANTFSPLQETQNCCSDYNEISGNSFGAGLQYYYPLNSNWSLRLGIGFYGNNLELRNVEAEMINVGGELFNGQFEHILSVDYSNYFTQVTAGYNIYKNLTIVAGGKLLINKTLEYNQYEKIIMPEDRGVFVDTGTRTRNEFTGEISTMNRIIPVITIGVLYGLPLNKNKSAILSPEISFESNLNSLLRDQKLRDSKLTDSDWNLYSFHFGISISVNID